MKMAAMVALLALAGATARADDRCRTDEARRDLRASRLAESGTAAYRQKARAALAASPEACRDAAWHVVAAQLLREPDVGAIGGGGTPLTTAREALAEGLRRDARSAALLAMVAYVGALDARAAPALPDDACARAAASDDAALREYICAHAARRASRPAEAAERFARAAPALDARHARRFVDADVRRAEALQALGRNAAAIAAANAELTREAGEPSDTLFPTSDDLKALRARARAIAAH